MGIILKILQDWEENKKHFYSANPVSLLIHLLPKSSMSKRFIFIFIFFRIVIPPLRKWNPRKETTRTSARAQAANSKSQLGEPRASPRSQRQQPINTEQRLPTTTSWDNLFLLNSKPDHLPASFSEHFTNISLFSRNHVTKESPYVSSQMVLFQSTTTQAIHSTIWPEKWSSSSDGPNNPQKLLPEGVGEGEFWIYSPYLSLDFFREPMIPPKKYHG